MPGDDFGPVFGASTFVEFGVASTAGLTGVGPAIPGFTRFTVVLVTLVLLMIVWLTTTAL